MSRQGIANEFEIVNRARSEVVTTGMGNIKQKIFVLGCPLTPFEKYWYIGSLIKAIRENIKYPRGLPRVASTLQCCPERTPSDAFAKALTA